MHHLKTIGALEKVWLVAFTAGTHLVSARASIVRQKMGSLKAAHVNCHL